MTKKLSMLWHLRQLMAAKGMFQTTDLVKPLHERRIELSRQMVHHRWERVLLRSVAPLPRADDAR